MDGAQQKSVFFHQITHRPFLDYSHTAQNHYALCIAQCVQGICLDLDQLYTTVFLLCVLLLLRELLLRSILCVQLLYSLISLLLLLKFLRSNFFGDSV